MRSNKVFLTFTGCLFVLGLGLTVGGVCLGGTGEITEAVYTSVEDRDAGYGAFYVGPMGVHIGGRNGIHIDSDGVRLGGSHGIYVGPDGVRVVGLSIGSQGIRYGYGATAEQYGDSLFQGSLVGEESGELDAFTTLDVDISLGDVIVETGADYSVTVSYDQRGGAIQWTQVGNNLRVYSESEVSHITNLQGGMVYITVPDGAELERMTLHSDLGDIQVIGDLEAAQADLSTDLGNVESYGLIARELTAGSSLGDVTVEFPRKEGVSYDLSTDLGDTLVIGGSSSSDSYRAFPEEYSLTLDSALGDVSLNLYDSVATVTEG